MKKMDSDVKDLADLDRLIEEITVDAHGDDENLWAFRQAFEDDVAVPCEGFVIGEPVSIVEFAYEGNTRRGLTARCQRDDGSEHVVAASDVVLPGRSSSTRYVAAYRKWLGLEPFPPKVVTTDRRKRHHKVAATDLDLSSPVELVALAIKERAARCRLLGSDRVITLRANLLWDIAPGEIVVVKPRKQWSYAASFHHLHRSDRADYLRDERSRKSHPCQWRVSSVSPAEAYRNIRCTSRVDVREHQTIRTIRFAGVFSVSGNKLGETLARVESRRVGTEVRRDRKGVGAGLRPDSEARRGTRAQGCT